MKRLCTAILMLSVSLFSYSAGMQESSIEKVSITDSLGREVLLPSETQRIVLAGRANLFLADALYLFPEATERVIALAQTDQGMGDFFPFLDTRHDEKKRLPNSAGVEEILSLNPDLVLLKDSMYQQLGTQLEALSFPVVTLGLESYDEYVRDIGILGSITGNQERSEELIKYFSGVISEIETQAAKAETAPRVLMLYYVHREGTSAFHIPPEEWIQTYMVETAGGKAVWKDSHNSRGWQVVNFEQIAAWDPDMVFLISYVTPSREVLREVSQSPVWRNLRAFREEAVLPFPGDFHSWAQSDIRWFLGIQWLARQLHPQIFPDDMEDRVIDFYRDLYRIDETTIRESVLPRLKEDLPGIRK